MNYPIPFPPGSYTGTGNFYPNASYNLGNIVKPATAVMLVTVDYTSLALGTINTFWFVVNIGSSPPLVISSALVTGSQLQFILSNGVPGVTYEVSVSISYGTGSPLPVRTDQLTVVVPSEGCGCAPCGSVQPIPPYGQNGNEGQYLNGQGTVFLNSGPRYFVNAGPPQGAQIMDQWYNVSTGIVSELITDGTNVIWMPLNPPQDIYAEMLFSEALTVTATNTLSTLTNVPTGNFFELIVNGETFLPVGSQPPFTWNGKVITWQSTTTTLNVGDTVTAVYSYAVNQLLRIQTDNLTITAINAIPTLSQIPNGEMVELVVNGRTFTSVDNPQAFTVSGNQITWTSTIFSVVPGDWVEAVYAWNPSYTPPAIFWNNPAPGVAPPVRLN